MEEEENRREMTWNRGGREEIMSWDGKGMDGGWKCV
jgi:hypothetical protein